jgi:AcrR family transcriptional regulator
MSVYGGVGADERRATRRGQLLAAALELVGTEGWQATTVRAICARARLTPRYFYESFADREELLVALFDEIAQECAAAVLAAVADAPTDARAKARAAIGAFVELVTDDPRKARVLFVEATGSEALTYRRVQTLRMFAQLVAQQGRQFYGVRGAGGVGGALIQTSALMLAGGLAETLLAWLDGSLEVTRERLIEDCTELFAIVGDGTFRVAQDRAANA